MTISRGPRGFFCLQDFRRGPVNVAVITLQEETLQMENWYVVSEAKSDQLFSDDAMIAEFATEGDESAYEKRDSFLIVLIKRACEEALGSVADIHVYHIEDWWPNHTRYVSVSAEYCTREFILMLQSLLTEEFSNYRIQLIVDSNLAVDESPELGALTIYADRVIVEDRVAKTLNI